MTGAISATNTLGLGSISPYTTMYDSYMPYSMYGGMYPGMTYPGMMGYPACGMTNYPLYWQEMQNQIEDMNMEHMLNMHNKMVDNEAAAYEHSASAAIRKNLPNSTIKQGIDNLYAKIQAGDQQGICDEYDKLQHYVKEEYGSIFNSKANTMNINVAVREKIENYYTTYTNGRNLRKDIETYGESSFANGWKQGLKPGHQDKYTDQTLYHIYGTSIDEYEDKEHKQWFGKACGNVAYTAKKVGEGAGIGIGALTAVGATAKGVEALGIPVLKQGAGFCSKHIFKFNTFKRAGIIGAIAWSVYSWVTRNNKDKA